MRLLDLFCGAGGAAVGYQRAGFDDIVGVDIVPQPNYPFTFIQADALHPPVDLKRFDLVHASPPCQAYSTASANGKEYPDLVAQTQDLVAGSPHVIENVPGAPIEKDLVLCGSMFGMEIRRHRKFELSWFVWNPPVCSHEWKAGRPWEVAGHPAGRNRTTTVKHHKYYDTDHARQLMEMPWAAHWTEVVEAIPPAYTKYIGERFLALAF